MSLLNDITIIFHEDLFNCGYRLNKLFTCCICNVVMVIFDNVSNISFENFVRKPCLEDRKLRLVPLKRKHLFTSFLFTVYLFTVLSCQNISCCCSFTIKASHWCTTVWLLLWSVQEIKQTAVLVSRRCSICKMFCAVCSADQFYIC